MSNKIYIDARYGFREDPLENWETINPVLERGEPSIVRDGKDGKWLKIGDGVTPWSDLPYKLGPVGPQGPKGDPGVAGKDAVTDQTYSPTSPNAQSGVAIEERLKSQVLLDVTLTEEQAGASSVMVAIPEYEYLKKAKQWNIQISFPYSGEYAANAVWFNLVLRDTEKRAFYASIASGNNIRFPTSSTMGYFNVTVFNTKYADETGMLTTYYIPPHPWAGISSANTANASRGNNWNYLSYCISKQFPPYLEFFNSSNFIFEAGTRIFLEVVL